MRHLFSTTSLARFSLLVLALGLAVALVPGCAGAQCHLETEVKWVCGSSEDRLPTDPDSHCYAEVKTKLVCDTGDDKKRSVWELPGTMEWLRDISWQVLDREFDVMPEDVQVRMSSDIPASDLDRSILSFTIVNMEGNPVATAQMPLEILRLDGESIVLAPERGQAFSDSIRLVAELLATAPEEVVLDEWTLRVPVSEDGSFEDEEPAYKLSDVSVSIMGWTP